DAIRAIVEIEVVDVLRSEKHRQRRRHFTKRQAKAARLVAIDIDQQLRIVGPELAERPHHLAALIGGAHHSKRRCGERTDVALSRLIEDFKLESAEGAETLDRR